MILRTPRSTLTDTLFPYTPLCLSVGGEVHRDALGGDQRRILLGEARVGLLEDADEVLLGERLQLDTDGKAALEFGEKIARLGDMEGSRRDEEDMVGLQDRKSVV